MIVVLFQVEGPPQFFCLAHLPAEALFLYPFEMFAHEVCAGRSTSVAQRETPPCPPS